MTKAERKLVLDILAYLGKPKSPVAYSLLVFQTARVVIDLEELLRLDAGARAREKRKP
jgi:hypothetical protein